MRFVQPAFKTTAIFAIFGVALLIPITRVCCRLAERETTRIKHGAAAHAEKMRELADDEPDTIIIAEDVFESLGIKLAQVQPAVASELLKLDGQLCLLSDRLARVHSSLPGEVEEVGEFVDPRATRSLAESPFQIKPHLLQAGDAVVSGQLLAVLRNPDLGEKKRQLVSDVERLRMDVELLKKLETTVKSGDPSEEAYYAQQRLVDGEIINVDKAERILRSWHVSESEIDALRDEAGRNRNPTGCPIPITDEKWDRVEVRSHSDGTIVERNVAVGDYISNERDLFKIADLSRMNVLAYVNEKDLSAIEQVPADQRNWKISLANHPKEAFWGSFDRIGPVIAPNSHSALVMGWVYNPGGRLHSGQYITATIQMHTPRDEVSIPATALVEQDGQSFVFVQARNDRARFTRRRVFPTRRENAVVRLACTPQSESAEEQFLPLAVADFVVTTGSVQLAEELTYLQSHASN